MVIQQKERRRAVIENMRGGTGSVIIEDVADKAALNGKSRLYARIILKPGCSIGYHVHENETEIFYLLKGTVEYDDNGTSITLQPGDVTQTPDGCGHAVANNSSEDAELMALIVGK